MGARCHQSVTRRTLTYMSENAWGARILRVVRERKKLNNSTSAVSFGERPTRGPSYTCEPSLVQSASRADYSKKSCDSLCVAIFSVPIFDSKKIHLFKKFQKVSNSFKMFSKSFKKCPKKFQKVPRKFQKVTKMFQNLPKQFQKEP